MPEQTFTKFLGAKLDACRKKFRENFVIGPSHLNSAIVDSKLKRASRGTLVPRHLEQPMRDQSLPASLEKEIVVEPA